MGEAVRYGECWCHTRFRCQQPELYPLFIRDRRWHQVLPDSPLGLQDSSGMVAGSHGPSSSIRLRAGLRGECPRCSEFPRRSDHRSSAAFLDADENEDHPTSQCNYCQSPGGVPRLEISFAPAITTWAARYFAFGFSWRVVWMSSK